LIPARRRVDLDDFGGRVESDADDDADAERRMPNFVAGL